MQIFSVVMQKLRLTCQIELTILIPTRNRPECLKGALREFIVILQKYNYPSQIEIVVSDNSSETIDTCAVVAQEATKCKNIKYRKHSGVRVSAESSMAYAVRFCRGKYIGFLGTMIFLRASVLRR